MESTPQRQTVSEKIRLVYPERSAQWEELIRLVSDPDCRGCLTCAKCQEVDDMEFVDVEEVDVEVVPWDSEEAWVYCADEAETEKSLIINCDNYQSNMPS